MEKNKLVTSRVHLHDKIDINFKIDISFIKIVDRFIKIDIGFDN